ncbi:MAG TPA: cysteine--tRNA ligase [Chlamydiales bacterium]|nr:cysteine--tRNA ligase [Chlamydiales bacterium]
MKLFNTASRQKETITAQKDNLIRMYTCGPTVYNFAHIGNLRTYIFEDLLRRTLKFFGFKVEQVMNLTDVDDKTIKGAIEKNITLDQYTAPYTQAFFEDLASLGIEKVEHYPKATDYIPEMISLIETLIKKGHAYTGKDNSVYFSISSFHTYGKLSHLNLEDLKVGASERDRLTQDEYDKERIADFVLWKAYDPIRDGKIYWESPFGKGRPGWHIECSAMAMKLLGKTIDIHCGGVDNMFPHHENEIAQSECCTGMPFVRYWAHAEHLLVDHRKMSKSLGNFYTLRDLLKKGYSPKEIRYMLLQTHYRIQLNFTFQELDAIRAALTRVHDFIRRLKEINTPDTEDTSQLLNKTKEHFDSALADDLNISVALSAIFDLVREGNFLADQGLLGKKGAEKILHLLHQFDQVLNVLEPTEVTVPQAIEDALMKREEARKAKNFKLADELRDFIYAQGYVIEDTKAGLRVKKK